MEIKEPPNPQPKSIVSILNHWDRGNYDVDNTYQRPPGAWTDKQEQYLIDSVLRGLPVPTFFIHIKNGKRWIVDGQHRLIAFKKFFKNDLELNDRYSADIIKDSNGGRIYDDLHEDYQFAFDNYPLPVIELREYSDEDIRSLFKRLQSGTTLSVGEKLNAYPGEIVPIMRELGNRKFFKKILPLGMERYLNYKIAATFLYLENKGIADIGAGYIYDFFERYEDLDRSSDEFKKVKEVLRFLGDTLDENMAELPNQAWVISFYLFISYLIDNNYVIEEKRDEIKRFLKEFYDKVNKSDVDIDRELIDFDRKSTKGTTSKSSIQLRHKILLDRFFSLYKVDTRDEERSFTYEQKREIFRRDGEKCQICNRELDFNDENTHYHHKKSWIEGGSTTVQNGLLVCKNCHLKKIHGTDNSNI
ncbi:MAG: DUF262 domain-containing protein [Archaeoglobaceae archaeon]